MLTKNFYMKLAVETNRTAQTDGPYPHGFGSNYKDASNYYIGYSSSYLGLDFNYISSTNLSSGVMFGDGNTPVTVDDYNISGNRITNLTVSKSFSASHADESKATASALYTITNNNVEAVTIREVAMFRMTSVAGSGNTAFYLMIDRTVLDSPVTIPAGGVGMVTYTINLNYPV